MSRKCRVVLYLLKLIFKGLEMMQNSQTQKESSLTVSYLFLNIVGKLYFGVHQTSNLRNFTFGNYA